MKQVIGAIIILVIVAIALTFGNCVGSGLGGGAGKGEGSGNGSGNGNATTEEVTGNDASDDEFKGAVYSITVVENDYFYDNNRMELEAIESMLKENDGEKIVEIKEDKASIKAYNKLVDLLEELDVNYVEK